MNNPILPEQTFTLPAPTLDHGTWRLDPNELSLKLRGAEWRSVDLTDCSTCGAVLDWVFHYRGRLTVQERSDLLNALEEILDPRANLCSSGRNLTCDSSALVKAYVKEAKRKRP